MDLSESPPAVSSFELPARPTSAGRVVRPRSLFLPLFTFALAFVGWLGLQTWQLAAERAQLRELHASQEAPSQQAVKVRASADALAAATASLAAQGNATARYVAAELSRRGITLQVVEKTTGSQR